MDKFQEIKNNFETCGMLLIGEKEVHWLVEKFLDLEKQVDYWKVNYNIKEQVTLKQHEDIEKLHAITKTEADCQQYWYDKTQELEKEINELKPTKLEDKSKLILKLTQEIVDETKNREDNIGGLMRSFGNEYVLRMQTFANFFKGI